MAALSPLWKQAQVVKIRPADGFVQSADVPSETSSINADVNGRDDKTDGDKTKRFSSPSDDLEPNRSSVLHPKEALTLIVGDERQTTGVRSIAVSTDIKHLSAAWREVYVRSSRTGVHRKRHVRLAEDDCDMMLVLMWIVHAKFDRVPKTLSLRQLLEMARICSRYDCVGRVSPFLASWIAAHQPKILTAGYEQWLYVACQFGLVEEYLRLAKHLALNARVDDNGELLNPGTSIQTGGYILDKCLAQIRVTRIKTISKLLDIAYGLVASMVDRDTCKHGSPTTTPPGNGERSLCTLFNHGVLVRFLRSLDLWPPVLNATVLLSSVSEIAGKLNAVQAIDVSSITSDSVMGKVTTAPGLVSRHEACDAGRLLKAAVQTALDNMELPCSRELLEAMRANAVKSGMAVDEGPTEGACSHSP